MIDVDFSKECEARLDKLAILTGRTKDSLIQEAVEEALPRFEREAGLEEL